MSGHNTKNEKTTDASADWGKNKCDFEYLFNQYSDVIYRMCLYKTSNTEVARDLTQETFLKLFKAMISDNKDGKNNGGNKIERPKSYIYQIARNLIVDYYKSAKTISLDLLNESGHDFESNDKPVELLSEIENLKKLIGNLDEDFQEIVYLRFIEGLDIKEISETLGISENLVSVRLNRAKQKLKEKYG